jgi:hypothetical protein
MKAMRPSGPRCLRFTYRGVAILGNPQRNRWVILDPFEGVWGAYRSAADARKEVRSWAMSKAEILRKRATMRRVGVGA